MAKGSKTAQEAIGKKVSSYAERTTIDMMKDLKAIYSKAVEKTNTAFLAKIDSFGGNITPSGTSINAANDVINGFIKNLKEAGFDDLVNKYTGQSAEQELFDFYEDVRPESASKLLYVTSKSTAVAFSKLNTQFSGLSLQQAQKIGTEVMTVVMGGGSKQAAINAILNSFNGSAYARYAPTYITTGIHDFVQQVELISAQMHKEEGEELYWEYVGPDDGVTRDECLEGLQQQFFTDEEKIAFDEATGVARAYNCRHFFVEITKEAYEAESGKVA